MPKGGHLAEFEQLVLLALLVLKENAYGVTVRREIQDRTDREVAIGAVYATLERLEGKGYVKCKVSKPDPVPGGRAKKMFHITRAGARALIRSREMIKRMTKGVAVDTELNTI